jgi:hypothetical protein
VSEPLLLSPSPLPSPSPSLAAGLAETRVPARRRRFDRGVASLLVAALVSSQLAFSSVALADDTAKAKAMFQEGLALEQSSDFSAALAKFEGVAQVKKTPQVQFHVAYCQEHVGRLVEALALYKEVLAEATAGAAADPKLQQVKTTTEEAIAGLSKKVPTVTVTMIGKGKMPDNPEITLDGKKLAALDKPQPVDPGLHTVEAKAEGKEPFSARVDAPEGTQRTIEIKWKDTKKAEPEVVEDTPPETPPEPPPAPSSSKLPYVVGGIGVAALITSGVFFLRRSSAQSELEDKCQGTLCPESAKDAGDRGKSATTIGNVALVIGVVGVGAGITLFALDSKKQPAPASPSAAFTAPRPRLRAGLGAGYATLSGSF